MMRTVRNTLAILLVTSVPLLAADPNENAAAGRMLFESKIRPVLVKHCYGCHSASAEKVRGGLLLDSKPGWQRGGDSGEPVIVPGQANESLLVQYIRHQDGLEMPPDEKLPDAVVRDFVTWIDSGAFDPRDQPQGQVQRADKSWWSLQPLATAEPPSVQPANAVEESFGQHPIDQFILAQLHSQGLTPNPPAGPRSLIRRMSYDVTGLPPSPDEVDAFVHDFQQHPDRAVESLVDRLLASPRYGEHWGRHWLDVVRFGESNGFERNVIINDLWPFRDYVIESLNRDKPFDQFFLEHLAGDVLGPDDPEMTIGSAFLVAGPYDDVGNQDPVAQATIRAATLDEIITTTGSAFLGLTIHCARCHHHKFDPVPTEDYYRLRAAFEGIHHGRREVASRQERDQRNQATRQFNEQKARLVAERNRIEKDIESRARQALAQIKFARGKIDPQGTVETFDSVQARYVKFVMHAHTGNPQSAVGAKLVEFEIWSAEELPRNVALASAGAKAAGAQSTRAEDFPEAYGPQYTIDGSPAEQWFIGSPAELTVTLAEPTLIDRIAFNNSRGIDQQSARIQGETPCEYEVQVSLDGKTWTTVASSVDRAPWSEAHGLARVRRDVVTDDHRQQLAALGKQIAEVDRQLGAVPPLRQVWVGNHRQPKQATHVHQGGDPMKPGAIVVPASLQVLDQSAEPFSLPEDAAEGQRRLALARWIVADDNPLTPRVLANRVWQYHFGTGIVDTPNDFGFLGGQPTHPELLDWLAQRLKDHGWRLKPLHREILLSRTYRQSAAYRPEAAQMDGDARLLWRFPPRRLSAEEIRDTMLLVSGQLNEKAGGPGFRLYKFTQNNVCTYTPLDVHGPDTFRRAVYHQNARASVVDLLSDFDLPDTSFSAPYRSATTSPFQALTLLNHRFTLDMATALAERAKHEMDSTKPEALVSWMYRQMLQRSPTEDEHTAAVRFVERHGADALGRAMFNMNEVLYVE
jgi:mono/diheme cytochrome c family protein